MTFFREVLSIYVELNARRALSGFTFVRKFHNSLNLLRPLIWYGKCNVANSQPLSDCHTLPDSINGRVTDSKILCPFVSVRMHFLFVLHAVNALRVR